MQDIEFAMTCVGVVAGIIIVGCILALAAHYLTPWVVPAVISGTVLGWLAIKTRR